VEFEVPQGTPGTDYRISHVSYYPLQTPDGQTVGVVAIIRDTSPERELEQQRRANIELLELLNAHIDEDELVTRAARVLRDYAGCEGAATRLCTGDGPALCALGDLSPGQPADECLCGRVISGSLDVSEAHCTARGGFWTNSLSAFGGTAAPGSTPPTCQVGLRQGYEAVAVLPLRAQGRTIGLVHLHHHRQGRFTAEGAAFLQRLADSVAIGLAHRRAQQALREREAHLRTVLDSVPDLAYETDFRSGEYTYVSPSAERILGYTAEEVKRMGTRGYEQRVHPDNAGLHNAATKRLARAGREDWSEPALEYRWLHKDGEYRWLSANRRLLRDEEGRPMAIIGLARDITARKRAEEALRQSEARYRLLVENAGVPIVVVNRDGVVEMLNGTAADVLSGAPEDIAGKSLWELVPASAADQCMATIRPALDSGSSLFDEITAEIRGRKVLFSIRIDPVRDEDGTISRVQVVGQDITAHVQREQELLTHQQHLRALASELALTEERERRQIAADLHDRIGQALTIAVMKTGLLEGDVSAPDARRDLREVSELIGQALHATRSLTFELSPPILYDLGLEPALEWLAEHVQGEHAIEVSFRDDGARKLLDADIRVTLFKAAREALFNVVKHARTGKAEVAVSRCGDSIEVLIRDDGIGFDPAERLERRAESPGNGADGGFGLFNMRERLHQLGGQVKIDSRPGCGTCITLRAPLRRTDNTAKEDGA
jgi:PAS domain S-box-containing protein